MNIILKLRRFTVFLFTVLSFVSCVIAQEEDSVKSKQSLAVFPAVSFAPETSLQFGAAAVWVLRKRTTKSGFNRESTISPFLLYTLKNQIISAINLNIFTEKGNVIEGSLRFYNFPDSYFGIGNGNDPDVSEQYKNVFFQSNGRYLQTYNERFFYGLGWDAQFNTITNVQDGGMLAVDHPVGIEGGFLFGVGPALRFDTRNSVIYPSKGYFVAANSLFNYIGDFKFTTISVDARKYMSLWNDENILAVQFSGNFTAGNEVPFYKMPQLGGDERLRGIANASLYRDRQMLYAQLEYRRPLFWRLGMTVFAGVGDVADNLMDFHLPEFKYVTGIGGRFAAIPKDKLNLRLDLGIATGGQLAIYAGISEAF